MIVNRTFASTNQYTREQVELEILMRPGLRYDEVQGKFASVDKLTARPELELEVYCSVCLVPRNMGGGMGSDT